MRESQTVQEEIERQIVGGEGYFVMGEVGGRNMRVAGEPTKSEKTVGGSGGKKRRERKEHREGVKHIQRQNNKQKGQNACVQQQINMEPWQEVTVLRPCLLCACEILECRSCLCCVN